MILSLVSCLGRALTILDGKATEADYGADVDAAGEGIVAAQRVYQPVRQGDPVADREFEIQFLDPSAEALAFTFG